MNDRQLGNCILCHTAGIEVRHINLYTIGSEGTWACHACEMKLVAFARSLSRENGFAKIKSRLLEARNNK